MVDVCMLSSGFSSQSNDLLGMQGFVVYGTESCYWLLCSIEDDDSIAFIIIIIIIISMDTKKQKQTICSVRPEAFEGIHILSSSNNYRGDFWRNW